MRRRLVLGAGLLALVASACQRLSVRVTKDEQPTDNGGEQMPQKRTDLVVKSDAEWRAELTTDEYRVTRQAGTEPAFRNAYWDNHARGRYRCSNCGLPLFDSEKKFESGTGWPSFWAPVGDDAVDTHEDRTFGMVRTEARCARCGAHLGHLFNDGPAPTRLRYCMNSASLEFEPDGEGEGE